jgi:exodeoxyribonuclease (lambda-induced)
MEPIFVNAEQGTDEWKNLKLSVISASNILKALAKKGTETRNSYMMELIGQLATRQFDEINAKNLEYGKINESAARAQYEFETGNKIEEIGFIYTYDKRMGASPDGIMPSIKKGLELKCPATARVHADFLCNDKIKPEYYAQVQFSLYVSGYKSWDFSSFHPNFKTAMLKIVTIFPDHEMFKRFDEELPLFIKEMDEKLEKIGISFGQQWQ